MPPATTTTWPETWPERVSEASTTTWAAMSSGVATFRSGIVFVILRTRSSSSSPRVIGECVQPGATAFTRASGAMRATSFFSESRRPAEDAGLRRRVVGVALLAEHTRRRSDEDE
jgi:hypothetical protein